MGKFVFPLETILYIFEKEILTVQHRTITKSIQEELESRGYRVTLIEDYEDGTMFVRIAKGDDKSNDDDLLSIAVGE